METELRGITGFRTFGAIVALIYMNCKFVPVPYLCSGLLGVESMLMCFGKHLRRT